MVSIFDQVGVGQCGSALIGVEDEEQRREDTALRRASGGVSKFGEGVVDQHSL